MRYKKTIKYNLKRILPMLGIAGATLLPVACKKPLVQHDTTYTWNPYDWNTVKLGTAAAASADSAEVRYVFLKNDGTSFEGCPTTLVLKSINKVINYVAPENQHKIRGAGTLNEIGVGSDQERLDSTKLANMGFKFGKVRHGNYR